MENDVFRKYVMKTVPVKAVKIGLRHASKNTARAVTARQVACLKYDVGNVMHALNSYILGLQLNQEMRQAAYTAMGDVGADIVALCKLLKVKPPTATKKVKLTGTLTAALLQFDMLCNDMLGTVNSGVFSGAKMTYVKKEVVLPAKGGAKEIRDVEVIDQEAEKQAEEHRVGTLRSLLTSAVDLYWRLTMSLFKEPPAKLFDEKFSRMKSEFPNVEFDAPEEPETAAEEPAKPEGAPIQATA